MAGKGGRKKTTWSNSWNHGETKVIRIPAALEKAILAYARALDSGKVPPGASQLQGEILLAIDQFVADRLANFHPNQYGRTASTHTRRWDELRRFRDLVASGDARSGLAAESRPVFVRR